MEVSQLSKSEIFFIYSNRHLEIIWKRADEYHLQYEKRLVNVIGSKEQSGIKLTKEIFEWKPVNDRNVKGKSEYQYHPQYYENHLQ